MATYKRKRIYEKRSDVPANIPKTDTIIVHEELKPEQKRKVTLKTCSGTNFIDTAKEDFAIAMIDMLHKVEKLSREIVEGRVREKFYMKKLVEAGISTVLDPEEIEEFKVTLDTVLVEQVDRVLDGDLLPIREHIQSVVSNVIAESKHEFENNPEYEIIRLQNHNCMLDSEIDKCQKSQIAQDKKAKIIKTYIELQHKNHTRLDELRKKYKVEDEPKEKKSGGFSGMGGIDLSSFGSK